MTLSGHWRSFQGYTSLVLQSDGTFNYESANGRLWGKWEAARLLSKTITFLVQSPAGEPKTVKCSYDSGTERDTGSSRLEVSSKGGSPFDGTWYRSPKSKY
jgi:hypothetical protein